MKRLLILGLILVNIGLLVLVNLLFAPWRVESEAGYWVAKELDGSYVIGVGRGGNGVLNRSFDQYVDDDVLFALNHMSPTGGKLLFTPGDFYLQDLTIAKERLDFAGSGRATRFLGNLNITGYPTVQYATTLHDFWFEGTLRLNNSIRSWHYNLYFKGGSPALWVSGNSIWFSNIVFDYAAPAAIIRGHSIHFDGGEMYGGGPLIWEGGQGGSLENFVIEGAGTYGLKLMGLTNTMLVQNNYFELNNSSLQPDIADIFIKGTASGIALRDNFFTGEKVSWAISSTAPYTIISGGRSYNKPVYLGGYGGIIEGQLAIFPKPTISADTISIAPTRSEGAGVITGGWIKPPAWNRDPDTTGWGLYDMGRMWGNYAEGLLKYWDGTQIRMVQ